MFSVLFAVISAVSATNLFLGGATLGSTLYVVSRTKSKRR